MAHLIEVVSYETGNHITLKRASIEEIVPVSDSRTDVRFESGRSLAVVGNLRQVVEAVGNFLEFPGEREGTIHLINPETVEQVEQTSEGWCRLYMRSGRSYYVQGDRMQVSLKVEFAGAAAAPAPVDEEAEVITADFIGRRRLQDQFPASQDSLSRAAR